MKMIHHIHILALLLCAVAGMSQAGLTSTQFTDALGGTLDSHWVSAGGGDKVIVSEAATIPSGDGEVLQITGGSQAMLASGTESWGNVTASCSILPMGGSGTQAQGIMIGAQPGFDFATTDGYATALYLRNGGASTIRLMLNGGDVNLDFPGATGAEVAVPGNPLDGNYHKLTLRVDRGGTAALLTAYWDDTPVATFGPDVDWAARIPAGMAGVVTCYGSETDTYTFDNFAATWDDAPASSSSYSSTETEVTDTWAGSALDENWITKGGGDKALVAETATIPSGDATVLQIIGGSQAVVCQETLAWTNVTASCSILPVGGSGTQAQGIIVGAQTGFDFATTDGYFAALYLRNGGASTIRLMLNGGDVNLDFPGATGAEVAVPGNPLDGNYHKLTLKVDRGGSEALLTAYWDDAAVATFGPDASWANRVSPGMVGVCTAFGSETDTYKFDNFAATWDNPPAGDSVWAEVTINQTETPPTIDGTIDSAEWTNATPIEMNHENMANWGSMDIGGSTSDETLSGTFYFQWDETYLYGAAMVKDSTLSYLLNQYTGSVLTPLNSTDGIQLCLDHQNLKSGDSTTAGIYILDVVPGYKDNTSLAGWYQHWNSNSFPNTVVASSVVSGGYALEWAIKWSDLTPNAPTPASGTKIGYMAMIMDFDSEGENDLWWNAGAGVNVIDDPVAWNTLILQGVNRTMNWTSYE